MDSILGGALISGAASAFGAWQQNRANRRNAREQMDFQSKHSNTSYQRQIADLKAAGINPMLAANLGGASTPGGASSVAQNELEGASNSARGYSRTKAEVDNLRATNSNLAQQNVLLAAQTDQAKANTTAINSATALNQYKAANIMADTGMKQTSAQSMRTNAALTKVNTDVAAHGLKYGKGPVAEVVRGVKTVGDIANKANSAFDFRGKWKSFKSDFSNYADNAKRAHDAQRRFR